MSGVSHVESEVGVGGHIQIVRRFIDVVQAKYIRVINQLHKHNLALNPEHDLLLLFAGVGYGHTAGNKRLLGYDLDGSVLLRLDMLCNLDASCYVVSARTLLCVTAKRRRTGRAPTNRLSNFPISDHPVLAVAFRTPRFTVRMGQKGRRSVCHHRCCCV